MSKFIARSIAIVLLVFGPAVAQSLDNSPLHSAIASSTPSVPFFEEQALAPRALEQLQAYCRHLHALANRWCKTWSPAYAAGSPGTGSRFETQFPESPLRIDDQNPTDGHGGSEWTRLAAKDIARLHEISIEAMGYLNTFTEFGVMSNPLIRDKTGAAGIALTTADALAFLDKNPAVLVVFAWRENVPGRMKFVEFLWGGPLPLSPQAQMRRLRQQLRDIRLVWLVRTSVPDWAGADELRDAADDVVQFTDAIRRIKGTIDPSLAVFVGAGAQEKASRGDADRRDPEVVDRILREAQDAAVWDAGPEAALQLFEEAKRFAQRRAGELTGDHAGNERYAHSIEVARAGARALRSDPHAYLRMTRDRALREIRPDAYRFLRGGIDWPITLKVPGHRVDVPTPHQDVTITGSVIDPTDAQELQAPWLHSIRLLVQRSLDSDPKSPLPEVRGIPIELVNSAGERRIRPLHPVGEAAEPYSFYEAEFIDVEPGVYQLAPLALDDPPPPPLDRGGWPPRNPGIIPQGGGDVKNSLDHLGEVADHLDDQRKRPLRSRSQLLASA